MDRLTRRRSVLAAGLAGLAFRSAEATRGDPVIELLFISGVQRGLNEASQIYEKQLKAGVQQEVLKKAGRALEKEIRDAVSPGRMAFFIGGHVKKTMAANDVNSLLDWYRSALGRKFVDLDVEGSSLLRDEARLKRLGDEARSVASNTRLKLLDDLLIAKQEHVLMADLALKVGKASVQMLGRNVDPTMIAEYLRRLDGQRGELVNRFGAMNVAKYSVLYKTSTEAELRQLVAMSSTVPSARYARAVAAGTQDSVLDAMNRLIKGMQA
jgi:hypothetical protein